MGVFWEAQNVKSCKKPLDVWKKSLTDKSSFWSLQKVVQVADYMGFKKPYKTSQFEIDYFAVLRVLWDAQSMKNRKK